MCSSPFPICLPGDSSHAICDSPSRHVVFRGILAALTLCVGGIATGQERVILTPKPAPTPRINGAMVFGVRPGRPFLFTIAATGKRPMQYAVDNLPAGLKVDPTNGQITGSLKEAGTYLVAFRVKTTWAKPSGSSKSSAATRWP